MIATGLFRFRRSRYATENTGNLSASLAFDPRFNAHDSAKYEQFVPAYQLNRLDYKHKFC